MQQMFGGEEEDGFEEDEEDEEEPEAQEESEEQTDGGAALEEFLKKTPRRLPRFMIRPVPETPEDVCSENFRVFMKWALSLIQNNERITAVGKPEFICVNLPKDMAFVLDKANEDADNSLRYVRLTIDEQPEIAGNLEMYGGLFPKQICWNGHF